MRIGLVSYKSVNRDIPFNISQIERALSNAHGKADLICFGEAFLQGFDSLCWDYEADKSIALELSSETIGNLRRLTVQYDTALLVGYIEKDNERIYSSCVVIDNGGIIHNYRRISKGWKEYTKTDEHYREGTETGEFEFHGTKIMLSLCGDMWDFPERFKTEHLLIWPVYVDYTVDDWERCELVEYARQAALASRDTLMINTISDQPANHGGAFRFRDGKVSERIPFDKEDILIIDV